MARDVEMGIRLTADANGLRGTRRWRVYPRERGGDHRNHQL